MSWGERDVYVGEAVLLMALALGAAALIARQHPGIAHRAWGGGDRRQFRGALLLAGLAVAVVFLVVLAALGMMGLR